MVIKKSFERIDRLPPYVFAEVNSMKAYERAEGEDIMPSSQSTSNKQSA